MPDKVSTMIAIFAAGIAFSLVVFGVTTTELEAPDKFGHPKLHQIDAEDLYDVVVNSISDDALNGPNDESVVWAVFFYRHHSGACRRIRPAVEAIASTTNTTDKLRFAVIDCVLYQNFCEREGAATQPRVLIYKTAAAEGRRVPTETWHVGKISQRNLKHRHTRGSLIAVEFFSYFHNLKTHAVLDASIEFAPRNVLAKSITATKNTGHFAVEPMAVIPQKRPRGYLQDSHGALMLSLVDAVFKDGKKTLKGTRLKTMRNWVTTLASVYPKSEVRGVMGRLLHILKSKDSWRKSEYLEILHKFGVMDSYDDFWDWCKVVGDGIGGYPCGLWILFHVLLANSNTGNAQETMAHIKGWVSKFFGCEECAEHFVQLWKSEYGAQVNDHIGAVVWMWKAHNLVRDRLYKDHTTYNDHTTNDHTTSNKLQWPSIEHCPTCYTEEVQNGTAEKSESVYLPQMWRNGYAFEFLQEMFCYESDMLECAQFWDDFKPQDGWGASSILGTTLTGFCIFVFALTLLLELFPDEMPPPQPAQPPKKARTTPRVVRISPARVQVR